MYTLYINGVVFSAVILLLQSGCGKMEATVSGTVSYAGKPLTTGNVAFHPVGSGTPATATIGADGRYELRTASKAGLPPGEYVATVAAFEIIPGSPPMPGKLLIPGSYNRLETSGLRYTVESGENTIDIRMDERRS